MERSHLKDRFWDHWYLDIGSYADDNTPYLSGVTLNSTVK